MISQRFFSKQVQKILTQQQHDDEAQFMHYIRNWFRACDERGLDMKIQLWHLNNAYEYLLEKLQLDDYPPVTTHIAGIPVKMYEATLHCISTRFMLFNLSSSKSYNSRLISTLAVESFFLDLSKFKFGGLGAPKAVDIPKLISHVVYLNTTKHDPKRGFEFTTSTRDNYPVYLMEYPEDNSDTNEFKNHPFDKNRHIKKKDQKVIGSHFPNLNRLQKVVSVSDNISK